MDEVTAFVYRRIDIATPSCQITQALNSIGARYRNSIKVTGMRLGSVLLMVCDARQAIVEVLSKLPSLRKLCIPVVVEELPFWLDALSNRSVMDLAGNCDIEIREIWHDRQIGGYKHTHYNIWSIDRDTTQGTKMLLRASIFPSSQQFDENTVTGQEIMKRKLGQ